MSPGPVCIRHLRISHCSHLTCSINKMCFPPCVFRSSSLSAVNAMLREQLEQASLANEALSQDIRRLSADWTKAREELEQKESDWRREEEVREGCLQNIKHFKWRKM